MLILYSTTCMLQHACVKACVKACANLDEATPRSSICDESEATALKAVESSSGLTEIRKQPATPGKTARP